MSQVKAKLTDCKPRFVAIPGRSGMGMIFDVPGDTREFPLSGGVWFDKPTDGGEPVKDKPLWKRTGNTFENMTLEPSIRIFGEKGAEVWHGYLRNGVLEPC